MALGKEYEELRWFMLPREAKQLLDTPPEMRPFILYPDCKLPFKTTDNNGKPKSTTAQQKQSQNPVDDFDEFA